MTSDASSEQKNAQQIFADLMKASGIPLQILLLLYVVAVVLQTSDQNFIQPERFLTFITEGINLPLAAGQLSLPVINVDVPLGMFYGFSPVILLIVHYNLLRQWHERTPEAAEATLFTRLLILLLPLVGLILIARQYAPFSAVRPPLGTFGVVSEVAAAWMTLFHALMVVLDVVLIIWWSRLAVAQKDATRVAPDWGSVFDSRFVTLVSISGAVGVSIAMIVLFTSWLNGTFLVVWSASLPVAVLLAAVFVLASPVALRWIMKITNELAKKARDIAFYVGVPWFQGNSVSTTGSLADPVSRPLRCALIAFLVVAAITILDSRGLYLEGVTLASDLPAEVPNPIIVAALIRKGSAEELKWAQTSEQAWERARQLAWNSARGVTLDRWRLAGANLRRAVMPKASLVETRLENADLEGVNLYKAKLNEAFLAKADLRNANLRSAELVHVDLSEAKLDHAVLRDVETAQEPDSSTRELVQNRKFAQADTNTDAGAAEDEAADNEKVTDLSGASLRNSDLTGASFVGARLKGAKFQGATFEKTKFEDANLSDAVFSEQTNAEDEATTNGECAVGAKGKLDAILTNADLTRAKLPGVDLSSVQMDGADFTDADLRNVNLGGLNLETVKSFRGANLSCADLRGVTVNNDVLEGATLRHTRFDKPGNSD